MIQIDFSEEEINQLNYSQPKWDVNRQEMESFNFPKLN